MQTTATHPPEPPVRRWTTDDVPTPERFEYFANALSSAVVPMQVESDAPDIFSVAMSAVELGGLCVVHQVGTAHRSFRDGRDLARSGEQSAEAVATSVGLPVDVLHRELLAQDTSFGHALLQRRTTIASRMLASKAFRNLTLDDISERAGFASSYSMMRAIKRRDGLRTRSCGDPGR